MSNLTGKDKIRSNNEPLLQQTLSTLKVLNRNCVQRVSRHKKVTQDNFPQTLRQIQQQVSDLKYLQTKLKQTRQQNPIEFWMFNEQKTNWQQTKCMNNQVIFQIGKIQRECQILRAKQQYYTRQLGKIVNLQEEAESLEFCQEGLLQKYQRKLRDLYSGSHLLLGNEDSQMNAVQIVDEAIIRLLQARKEKRRLKQVYCNRKLNENNEIVFEKSLIELKNKYVQLVSESERLMQRERQVQHELQLQKITRISKVNQEVQKQIQYYQQVQDQKYQSIIRNIQSFKLIAEQSNKMEVASHIHNLLDSIQ